MRTTLCFQGYDKGYLSKGVTICWGFKGSIKQIKMIHQSKDYIAEGVDFRNLGVLIHTVL